MIISTVLTVATLVGTALMAGLFFMASVAIMPGLRLLPAPASAAAMQAINRAILHPVFLAVFLGTALLCAAVAVPAVLAGSPWPVAGGVLYLAGTFLVTIVCNVPMNNALDTWDPNGPETPERWADYDRRWTAWNHVRTVTSTAATAALALGLAL